MRFGRILGVLAFLVPGLAAIPGAALESAVAPGTARVWFLYLSVPVIGYDTGAAPTIYASGKPIGAIRGGTGFSRDLPPGSYQFSVDAYGFPTGQTETVQLAPGTQTYLQVFYSQTWKEGYVGGLGMSAYSFFIRQMSPQLARAYLPTLANTMGR